ncbi:MAG: glutathione peroxidase [Bacteroidales bacterium]|nr:glutathione peroxidase [Bacteroidales bacterium]
MKDIILMMLSLGFFNVTASPQENKSFHDFQVTDINGNEFDMGSLKGKKVLVVNTASKCGFTPQYADLERLYKEYGDRDFVIIGFPANNFLGQEPGTDAEIKAFCQLNYGVTFPMMSKISVRGRDIHPLYEWLTRKELNGVMNSNVSWNFQKYMIDESGNLVGMISPRENPYSDELLEWLNN